MLNVIDNINIFSGWSSEPFLKKHSGYSIVPCFVISN